MECAICKCWSRYNLTDAVASQDSYKFICHSDTCRPGAESNMPGAEESLGLDAPALGVTPACLCTSGASCNVCQPDNPAVWSLCTSLGLRLAEAEKSFKRALKTNFLEIEQRLFSLETLLKKQVPS